LISYEVIVKLITATKMKTGLMVLWQFDPNNYPSGFQVPDADMTMLSTQWDTLYGKWNYTIIPHFISS
jgi:Rhodopirellula transposase DDE domain